MSDAPARHPVSVLIPVAWGEMDAFQHVNNVVYARWPAGAKGAPARSRGWRSTGT